MRWMLPEALQSCMHYLFFFYHMSCFDDFSDLFLKSNFMITPPQTVLKFKTDFGCLVDLYFVSASINSFVLCSQYLALNECMLCVWNALLWNEDCLCSALCVGNGTKLFSDFYVVVLFERDLTLLRIICLVFRKLEQMHGWFVMNQLIWY